MADGLGSDTREMEDMTRTGSGNVGRVGTSWHGRNDRAGSPGTSPQGSLTDDEMAPIATRTVTNATFQPEDAETTENASNEETLFPLAGINDDGYFGDDRGQWLRLEPRAEIVFETRGGDEKTAAEEVLALCNNHGGSFIVGLMTIAVLCTVLILWATHLEATGGGNGGRRLLRREVGMD